MKIARNILISIATGLMVWGCGSLAGQQLQSNNNLPSKTIGGSYSLKNALADQSLPPKVAAQIAWEMEVFLQQNPGRSAQRVVRAKLRDQNTYIQNAYKELGLDASVVLVTVTGDLTKAFPGAGIAQKEGELEKYSSIAMMFNEADGLLLCATAIPQ